METIELKTREEWRAWLVANHNTESEIWLVYYKKKTGIPSIEYEDSVVEALCWGWVDSLIKKLDDSRYARKFTPRKEDSQWSLVNKKRVEKALEDGSMTAHGMQKVQAAKRLGTWDRPVKKPELKFEMLPAFAEALRGNPKARETFEGLSATDKKQYLGWMETAKRPATRERRIAESIRLLEQGKKLGLK